MASNKASQQDSVLGQLQHEDQKNLLNTIDELRALGLSAQLKLPQVIVCGDTSSGKSSVLEAISGVRFPANQLTCTRFAAELRLRRDSNTSFTVRIEPAEDRTPEDQETLKAFGRGETFTDVQEFPGQILRAAEQLSKVELRGDFLEDVLVAEIHGPDRPMLTLVDLPGFIHASANPDSTDITTVKKIVDSYMSQSNSIVLAVIDADNDWANQTVFEHVKTHRAADRTLGIMTKLDKFSSTSPRGIKAIQCAMTGRNEYLALQYGWHMLRNRDYDARHASLDERNAQETEFFRQEGWKKVPEGNRGALSLQSKLSKLLLKEIRSNLPTIIQDVRSRLRGCEDQAEQLGEAKETEEQRREELTTVSSKLHRLIDAGINGTYRSAPFFAQASQDEISHRRLRAALRNRLRQFARYMHEEGMRYAISDGQDADPATALDFSCTNTGVHDRPTVISPQDLRQSLKTHIKHNVGTEVSGRLPSSMYASALSYQCSRWTDLAIKCAEDCWYLAKAFYVEALYHAAPPHIAGSVQQRFVEQHFVGAERKLLDKITELVKPYNGQSFCMFNQKELDFERVDRADSPEYWEVENQAPATDENWAIDDVLNWVHSAYRIALNTFLDNFSNLAIEFCLVEDLSQLFTPINISAMNATQVEELTREPENIVQLRSNNKSELEALRNALEVCTNHMIGRSDYSISPPRPQPQSIPPPSNSTPASSSRVESRLSPRLATPEIHVEDDEIFDESPAVTEVTTGPKDLTTPQRTRLQPSPGDPRTMTPPETPPRSSTTGSQLPADTDEQQHTPDSRRNGKRAVGVIPSQYPIRL